MSQIGARTNNWSANKYDVNHTNYTNWRLLGLIQIRLLVEEIDPTQKKSRSMRVARVTGEVDGRGLHVCERTIAGFVAVQQ